jgi:hypothetical protein
MPAGGPAPKDPGQRRRYNQPARAEWVDLPALPLDKPVLPPYKTAWRVWVESRDKDGNPIKVRRGVSKAMWDAWRSSAVTTQYGPEDIATICYLAESFNSLTDAVRMNTLDRLGLTPKGKRDLRWRSPLEAKQQAEANEKTAQLRRLRVVAEREAKG